MENDRSVFFAAFILSVLQIILLILKIFNLVSWDWLVILLPFEITYAVLTVCGIAVIIYILCAKHEGVE